MKEILSKTIEVLKNPSGFFEEVKKERGIGSAIKFLVVLTIVTAVGLGIITLLQRALIVGLSPLSYALARTSWLILIVFIGYITALIYIFLVCIALHLFARIFKCKKGFGATTRAVIYGATPIYLLSWLPFIAPIATLYGLYLTILGISKLHEVSMKRAVLIVLPLFIVSTGLEFTVFGLDAIFGPYASELFQSVYKR